MTRVEIRCPVGPQRLFAKLMAEGGKPKIVDGNLIEFSCPDCKRDLRRDGQVVDRVLHRYNLAGEHIETEVIPGDDTVSGR
jgi:hypothetical protein